MKSPKTTRDKGDSFRVIALMSAYNEGDIIGPVIEHLVRNGVDTYLLDNHSTDDTIEQAGKWLKRGVIAIETFPSDANAGANAERYDWTAILRRKEELAATLDADWFLHYDADEIRDSPWDNVTLREALEFVDRLDFNCIDFRIFEFPPIDDGFRQGLDPATYFTRYRDAKSFDQLQLKGWKKRAGPVSLVRYGGHDVDFPGRRVFPIPFLLRHYPIRGQTHGLKKVFHERKSRFVAEERAKSWHQQYDHIKDEQHSFLVDPETLKSFDLNQARFEAQVDNRSVREERRNSASAQAEIASELAAVTADLAAARAALAAFEAEHLAQIRAFESRSGVFEEEAASARAAYVRREAELAVLASQLEQTKAERLAQEQLVRETHAHLVEVQAALESLTRAAAELESRLTEANAVRAELLSGLDVGQRRIEELETIWHAKEKDIEHQRRHIDALEADLQRHREALARILNTKTWRWGAPLGRLLTLSFQKPETPDGPPPVAAPAEAIPPVASSPSAKEAAIDKLRDIKDRLGNQGPVGKILVPPIEVAEFSLSHGLKEVVTRSRIRLSGRQPWQVMQQGASESNAPTPAPVHRAETSHVSPAVSHAAVKLIAFYLPQYHPIPENDAAWGKGFTEWTNTTRALPLFEGHYQPHLPSDLGFYDLRVPETREEQARLARAYGIHGFCYYYYWFDRRRLLDRPLDDMLQSGKPDFPFCICWANEPWSRRWDGSEHEVIASQEYNDGYAARFIEDVIPILQDPRYIRVDGKPLLIIYRIDQLPDAAAAARIWRDACRAEGIGEICLAAMGTYGTTDPLPFGFDVSIEFPPHNLTVVSTIESKIAGLDRDFRGKIFDYATCVDAELKRRPKYPQFRGLMPNWDNTARRGKHAMLFHGSTPAAYERWLRGLLDLSGEASAPHSPFVFVNAWNEWAEGTHLEPDQKHGRQYLEATAAALLRHKYSALFTTGFKAVTGLPEAAIVIPAYNHVDVTLACLDSLAKHRTRWAIEVIVVDDGSTDLTQSLVADVPGIRYIRSDANQGFVRTCNTGASAARADYLVFLNNDTTVSDGWLDELRATFDAWPRAGLAGSKLIWPNGRMQECGSLIYRDGSAENYGREGDPDDSRYCFAREADYVTGAAMMIRRDLFLKLGSFDERYAPGYYEDVDLAFRVREAGYQVVVNPLAVVNHFEGGSSGLDVTVGAKRYQVINHEKFRDRWAPVLAGYPDRDRARAIAPPSRRILVIDWTVPRPDRDAGSVRMAAILRILRDLGYAVTFVSRDVSCDPRYAAPLEQIGIEVLRQPYVPSVSHYLEKHGSEFGTVIVSRRDVAVMHLATVKAHCPGARVIFDTVDLHFIREMREQNVERRSPSEAREFAENQSREIELIRLADTTLVVSPYERDVLAGMLPDLDVRIVSIVHEITPTPRPFAARSGVLFVGFFVHKPNGDAVKWFVREVLPLLRVSDPDFKVHIVGSEPPADVRALASDRVLVHGYVEDLDSLFDACRLSIAPLRYGAGVKGKIGQSLALGVPCVTTAIGAEGMALEDGVSAMIADDAAGFAARLERAYADQVLWERLRERGLEAIQRTMSTDAARVELKKLFEAPHSRHAAPSTEQIRG